MLIFVFLFLMLAAFSGWMALQEYGDRQRWLTPLYIVLAVVCVVGSFVVLVS